MNRALFIILSILLGITIILLFSNLPLLEKGWLWIVGFSGYIVLLIDKSYKYIKGLSSKSDTTTKTKVSVTNAVISATVGPKTDETNYKKEFEALRRSVEELQKRSELWVSTNKESEGTTVTVLRYSDIDNHTLGLLFINKDFFCYTLEDNFPDSTRIPEGSYKIEFKKTEDPFTDSYQKQREWFQYHLQITGIESHNEVLIHNGGINVDGGLMIVDGGFSIQQQDLVDTSMKTYERMYKILEKDLQEGSQVGIKIYNEEWFLYFNNQYQWQQTSEPRPL